MAAAIVISTFGCNNGLILAGARVSYAMAKDGLFFRSTGTLNKKGVPASALLYQGVWIIVLILLRTQRVGPTGLITYGNLYSDLLDYVVFSVLIFYALTIAGIFVLRMKRPNLERPYRAFGYPFVPADVYSGGAGDHVCAVVVQNPDGLAGFGDCVVRRAGISALVTPIFGGKRARLDLRRCRVQSQCTL